MAKQTGTATAKGKTLTEMGRIRWFSDAGSTEQGLVGGKAINLGVLANAGFPVPNGFTVTTAGYRDLLRDVGLEKIAAEIDYDDASALDAVTGQIRDLILQTPVPDGLADEIVSAYEKLGPAGFVAVRSSATAEDIAGASFAGLYESYLNVTGHDEVIAAIRQCWASLWSTRAAAYRHQKGLDVGPVSMAVIVQTMASPEVSGVMFTANPLTTATDEIVINASWGLGEAIVQGMVTPDQYTVKTGTLAVIERILGTKALRIIRNPDSTTGTVTEPTPSSDQQKLTLSDDQVADLAAFGRKVTALYDEVPQDIEWALSNGEFCLLQTRPVTGLEFSWDDELDSWQWAPEADEDTLWTRAFSDEFWTGAISPMMYSFRGRAAAENIYSIGRDLGFNELSDLRMFKFFKGMAYFNPEIHKMILEKTWPPFLRAERSQSLSFLPPTWHQEILQARFSYLDYLRMHARLLAVRPQSGVLRWFKTIDAYIHNDEWDLKRIPDLGRLSDSEIRRLLDKYFDYEFTYGDDMAIPFYLWVRDGCRLLELIVAKWYDGPNEGAYGDLMAGCRVVTKTFEENLTLFKLSERVRASEVLSNLFRTHEGSAFFEAAKESEEGRAFLEEHQAFVEEHGHRGMEDRDFFYPRRFEDPHRIDYRVLKAFLSSDSLDPEAKQQEVNSRREAAYDDVLENIKRKPLGALKAEAFKGVYDWVHKFIAVRDDERWSYERYMWAIKLTCLEIGRRLTERELLEDPGDCLFVNKDELFALLEGRANVKHASAKIAGRKIDFERQLRRDPNHTPPMYLQRNRPVSIETDEGDGLRGMPTSAGRTTGTARVVGRIEEIHRVKPGEILICNATDPGWTPVFMIIQGIVTETGGILAHASCLSREYGLPSVQLPNAMQLIPDGATITVDGYLGEVEIHEEVPSIEPG